MSWRIIFAESARRDLRKIRDYISNVLVEPEIARKQIVRIVNAISSLDHMPERHRLYDHEPWRSKGLRTLPVDNYLVFYVPDETRTIVEIIHIIYGGRDIEAQLNQTEQPE